MRRFLIALCSLMFIPSYSVAESWNANDGVFLVDSCREVLEIYKNREEKTLLAAQRTSLKESMMAGFCIGAIQQFIASDSCRITRGKSWFELAKQIAENDIKIHKTGRVTMQAQVLLTLTLCE
ncbi:MAG: hypothetical protein KBT79_09560 [Thalassolituus oleivorans]|nr:hypothetical protein [Thalassolituus oleivorans]